MLNASNLAWTATGGGKSDSINEEGSTLPPSGQVLTVDISNITNFELYSTSTGFWSTANNTMITLVAGSEIGSAGLRPDGAVFATGETSNTAIYHPGRWKQAPA